MTVSINPLKCSFDDSITSHEHIDGSIINHRVDEEFWILIQELMQIFDPADEVIS